MEDNGLWVSGFQASLPKLLPELIQTILNGILSEGGSPENFS